MASFNKKVLLGLGVMIITIMGLATDAHAVLTSQTVQAYQGIKIVYNGKELTDTTQPYSINNTTFVPLRMLMNNFGKTVVWDSVNSRVLIVDSTTATEASIKEKDAQIATLQDKIADLQSRINTLNENTSDDDLSDIEDTLDNYFEDAGTDYFDDGGIDVTLSLSGDEDDLAYTIKLDFSSADDYDDLTEVSQSDLKYFLNAVKSKINSEKDGTDFDDAGLTGKLYDSDHSSYYVKYNGSSYTYSWDEDDEDDDTSLSDIEDALSDYFEDAGAKYFDDDSIDVTLSLSGDEDDLAYKIYINFDDADDYDNLTDVSQSKLKSFLNAVKSKIDSKINGTNYEDAGITGKLFDSYTSSYYVKYDGRSYTYSWDS
ncbi:MAG: stalk domain-containing protein [Syntrophomonas sp.]|nr:stalk domain-containing protein [Syntrophomonas sp.]